MKPLHLMYIKLRLPACQALVAFTFKFLIIE